MCCSSQKYVLSFCFCTVFFFRNTRCLSDVWATFLRNRSLRKYEKRRRIEQNRRKYAPPKFDFRCHLVITRLLKKLLNTSYWAFYAKRADLVPCSAKTVKTGSPRDLHYGCEWEMKNDNLNGNSLFWKKSLYKLQSFLETSSALPYDTNRRGMHVFPRTFTLNSCSFH